MSAHTSHGTGLSAQSNGERQCPPHLPHRQTRGWGLRQRHRRLPPCAILRDLEHSNRSAASIGMPHAQMRPSIPSLPVNEANQMLARHARPASVRASHPSNDCHLLPHPAPSPFAFSPTSLDSIPSRSYNTAPTAFPSIQHHHHHHHHHHQHSPYSRLNVSRDTQLSASPPPPHQLVTLFGTSR